MMKPSSRNSAAGDLAVQRGRRRPGAPATKVHPAFRPIGSELELCVDLGKVSFNVAFQPADAGSIGFGVSHLALELFDPVLQLLKLQGRNDDPPGHQLESIRQMFAKDDNCSRG